MLGQQENEVLGFSPSEYSHYCQVRELNDDATIRPGYGGIQKHTLPLNPGVGWGGLFRLRNVTIVGYFYYLILPKLLHVSVV
jgi:hypothetical protein